MIRRGDGGFGEERGLRKGSRERIEIERNEEENKEHRHLPLLVVQGTAFLLSSRLDSAVERCSSEVLVSSGAVW